MKERQGNSKNVKDDIQLVTLANENADKNIGELSRVWLGGTEIFVCCTVQNKLTLTFRKNLEMD